MSGIKSRLRRAVLGVIGADRAIGALPLLSDGPAVAAALGVGGAVLAGRMETVRPRGALARAVLRPDAPKAGPLMLAVRLVVTAGKAEVLVVTDDGKMLDRATCNARSAPFDVPLIVPADGAGKRLVVAGLSPDAAARLEAAALVQMPVLALPAMAPPPDLWADPEWETASWEPGPDDVAGRLRVAAFRGLTQPSVQTWIEGLRVALEPGDELSRVLYVSGQYEPATMLAIGARLKAGGVFVDVGAHCGLFSLFASGRVGPTGRVIAFEPSEREFVRLQAHIGLNARPWISPRREAVADIAGTVRLRVAEAGHAGHNTIGTAFGHDRIATASVDEVPAVTLDAALATLPRCDVIKMDIEGAEMRALVGAEATLARLRPMLVLEVFGQSLAGSGATVAELYGWLQARGYRLHDIDPASGALLPDCRLAPEVSKNIVAVAIS